MWWLVLLALVIGILLGVVYAKLTEPKPVAPVYEGPVQSDPPQVAAPVEFYYHPITRKPERRV